MSLDQPHWNVPKPAHLRPDSLISPVSSRLGHPREVLPPLRQSCPAVVWDLGAVSSQECMAPQHSWHSKGKFLFLLFPLLLEEMNVALSPVELHPLLWTPCTLGTLR